MKDKKTLLLIIVGIILVLIIITIVLTNTLKTKSQSNFDNISANVDEERNIIDVSAAEYYNVVESNILSNPEFESKGISEDDSKKVYTLNLSTLFMNAMDSVNLFNSRLGSIYDEEHNLNQDRNVSDIDFKKATYNCLDPIYTSNSNINEENINQLAGHYVFIPTSGYRGLQINQIVVLFGNRIDTDNKTQEEYGYIVQLNESDKVFSIIPYDFMKSAGITSMQEGNKIILNDSKKVEAKENNYYSPSRLDARRVSTEYLKMFKLASINNPDLAYSKLTSENKSKYGSAEKFKQYMNSNYDKLNAINVSTATEKKDGDYYTYTCYDYNGNTFYIKVNSKNAFEYSIELANIAF